MWLSFPRVALRVCVCVWALTELRPEPDSNKISKLEEGGTRKVVWRWKIKNIGEMIRNDSGVTVIIMSAH